MKLYYTKAACSLVCRIVINELGLPCEFESVDLRGKKTASGTDFYSINSKGSVPVLQLDNGQIITENAVILQYLADTTEAHDWLPAVGNFERYRVLEWLNYITTELHKGFSPLFNPAMPQEIKNDLIIPQIKSKLTYLNTHLEHRAFLAGNHVTLPDAYLFVMLLWAMHHKIDVAEWPHLARFMLNISKRPAVQASLQQESQG